MNVRNILIYGATGLVPAIAVNPLTTTYDGPWIDISNMVSFSVQAVVSGTSWIEVSNDPNIPNDGPNGQLAAPSAPTVTQSTINTTSLGNTGQYPPLGNSLPAQALSIKITYTTRNQPIVTPIPLYNFAVGETLPSGATAISVLAGNTAFVASPPSDALKIATGYNVYAQLGGSGPYVLQNTRGGPNSRDNAIYDGPIPLGTPFAMKYGFFSSGAAAPVADTSGGPGVGTNLVGTLSTLSVADSPISVIGDTASGTCTVAPSSQTWKWLRVRKTAAPGTSQAWLCGQLG